jgi:hypothetical protein
VQPDSKSIVVENVGTNWVEVSILNVPDRIKVVRVRAEILQGAGTSVALSLRERSEPTSVLDIAIEYSLTASPLDRPESIWLFPHKKTHSAAGTVYVAVKADSGTNSIRVKFDYE